MDVATALKIRKEKKKRAEFIRSDWHKRLRIGRRRKKLRKWRKPKGRHSKIRERRKGSPPRVDPGYGSPQLVKGTINGLTPVLITNIKDLEKIGTNMIGIISSKLGMKKKIEIINKAKEKRISININTEEFLERAKKQLEERKERRRAFEKRTKEEKKEEEKKPEEKEKKEEKAEEKEKKEIEKEIEKEKEELKKPIELKPEIKPKKFVEKKPEVRKRMALEK